MPNSEPAWRAQIVDKAIAVRLRYAYHLISWFLYMHVSMVLQPLSRHERLEAMVEGYKAGACQELLHELLDLYQDIRLQPGYDPSRYQVIPMLILADGSSFPQTGYFYDHLLDMIRYFDIFDEVDDIQEDTSREEISTIHKAISRAHLVLEWQLIPKLLPVMITWLRENRNAIQRRIISEEDIANQAKDFYVTAMIEHVHPLDVVGGTAVQVAYEHKRKAELYERHLAVEPRMWGHFFNPLTKDEADKLFLEVITSETSDLPTRQEYDEYITNISESTHDQLSRQMMSRREPILRARLDLSRKILENLAFDFERQ